MKLKLLRVSKISSKISSRGFSRFSRFLAAFVYLSFLSSVSYFATTENQVLHAYKDWTGLISTDDNIISSADVSSSDDISSESVSDDISEDIADMAVSNDTPASSENDNDSNDSFDSFVSHDTNDTEGDTEADTEGEAEEQSDTEGQGNSGESSGESSGNTGNTLAPVASGPDTPSEATPDSESIAILTTRLTADHHLIATLSISGVMGADVAVFPASVTGHGQHNNDNAVPGNATAPDSAGGNIYTVSNTASSPVSADTDNAEKPDSLLLNFENEEGVVESVRLWLDNEIDETVILDGITASNDNGGSNTISTDTADFSSRAYDETGSNSSQPDLAVPLSPVLSEAASSDLAAISDTAPIRGYTLESFIDLNLIKSPIIVILPETNEQYYFPNGTALANYANFAQEYRISEINATTRAEIEVRLEKIRK